MGQKLPDISSIDPKGLIKDAYAMVGIGDAECRTIFLDWAISVPGGQDPAEALPMLAAHYSDRDPDHPMSRVLAEGLQKSEDRPKRRGGAAGRR